MLSAIGNSPSLDWFLPARRAAVGGRGETRTNAPAEAAASPGEKNPEAADEAQGKSLSSSSEAVKPGGEPLSEGEQREVQELKKTDQEVRQHEQQHIAAGGSLVRGGASYSYQTGPDGKRYAVGGEVSIDTSEGRTPEETLSRARRIRAAALAPANPSPQDRSVAAAASQMEMRAIQEIAQKNMAESSGETTAGAENASGQIAPSPGESAAQAYRQASAFGQAESANAPRFSAFA
ncbi:MAG: hypothetical protein LBS49_01770 [Candidatus Accumulibacter sp.]|jgi:hypothetical protein|nr:hypothetical protein [Accumulibacter sp.]